jgi:hypothetical protein
LAQTEHSVLCPSTNARTSVALSWAERYAQSCRQVDIAEW